MNWQKYRAAIALVALVCIPLGTWARPPAYQLFLVDHSKNQDQRLRVLLEENLPRVEFQVITAEKRYKFYPHWPVANCPAVEYFLTAYGKRLIAVGCYGAANASSAIAAMRTAIAADQRLAVKADAVTTFDAALASAAFGDSVSARGLARDAAARGFPERGLLRRLRKFLEKQ